MASGLHVPDDPGPQRQASGVSQVGQIADQVHRYALKYAALDAADVVPLQLLVMLGDQPVRPGDGFGAATGAQGATEGIHGWLAVGLLGPARLHIFTDADAEMEDAA